MKPYSFCACLVLLPLLPMKASAQEVPNKPDIWKSAGSRKATEAEIQALIATPGPALIDRNRCRQPQVPWGTGSPADVAAARLVEIGDPAIKPVLPLLNDKEMWRRRLAVEILGRIGNRQVTPSLLTLLQTEKEENVQIALTNSLSMLRDRRAETALIRIVHNGFYSAYGPGVQGLARLHTPRAIDTLLSQMTLPDDPKTPDYSTHFWHANMTAIALPEAGKGAFPALAKFITNKKTSPAAIALALGPAVAVGNKRLETVLLHLLNYPDEGVRNTAVNNLMKWPDTHTFPALVRVLHGVKGEAQMSAGIMLATLGTPEALDVLATAADSDDDNLRHAASNACRYLTTNEATPMLLHLLKAGRKDTPEYAAYTLGKLKEKSAVPALGEALASSSINLRSAAATALGNFDDTQAIGALLTALEDTSKDVRLIALRMLRTKHDDRIVPAFERLMSDTNKDVQQQADFGIKWQQTAVRHTAS